jgi:ribosomal protein L32
LQLLQGSVCSHIAHTICLHRGLYAEKADLHPHRIS